MSPKWHGLFYLNLLLLAPSFQCMGYSHMICTLYYGIVKVESSIVFACRKIPTCIDVWFILQLVCVVYELGIKVFGGLYYTITDSAPK